MADKDTTKHDDRRHVPDANPRVAPLSDVGDFQVAEGYPDPRGWDVVAADGRKVGTVHELIVDTGQLRTRYLDVALDKDVVESRDDRDVLIPIGAAQLDDTADHVVLGSLSITQLATLPEFTHTEITREYENSVLDHMPVRTGGQKGTASAGAARATTDYYDSRNFDDRQFYGNRATRANADTKTDTKKARDAGESRVTRSEEEVDIGTRAVQTGEVDVRKHVDTEHVSKPVTLRHEEVTIERRPIRADEAGGAHDIGDDSEIRIPITEEQVVVEKRVVPKEELVVKKRMVSEEKTVEADVRKERVDVDRSHEHDAPRDAPRDASDRR